MMEKISCQLSVVSRQIFLFSIFCLLFFGLAGCAEFSKKDVTTGAPILEPSAMLKFSDLPVPAGFKLIAKDSYSFESAGVRVGVLKYQGKANPDQVVSFYKEHMPMYNWNLLNVIEYGERMLNFDRDAETCIINLSPKGNSITATISLGPKSQVLSKKQEKPIK